MTQGTITMAIYKFSGLVVEEYPIINETEKYYIVCKPYTTRGRIPKDEVGKAIHNTSYDCPYVRVFLLNATKEETKEELAKWFEDTANFIRI